MIILPSAIISFTSLDVGKIVSFLTVSVDRIIGSVIDLVHAVVHGLVTETLLNGTVLCLSFCAVEGVDVKIIG